MPIQDYRSRLDGRILICLLAGMAGFCVSRLITYWNGYHFNYASIYYLSSANNLLAGNGLMEYDGMPYFKWPPLFPFLIAFFKLFGFHAIEAASLVSAAAFAFTAGGFCHLLRISIRSRGIMVLGSLSILVAIPALQQSLYLMAESLFTAQLVFFVIFFHRYLEKPTYRRLLAASAFAALACLTRHFGLVTIAVGVCAMMVALRKRPLSQRAAHCLAFAGTSFLPLGLWWLRNMWVAPRFMGTTPDNPEPVQYFSHAALDVIYWWLIPGVEHPPFWAGALVALAAACILIAQAAQARNKTRPPHEQWSAPLLAGFFFIIYMLAAIASVAAFTDNTVEMDRFLAPAWFALFLPFWTLLDNEMRREESKTFLGISGRHLILALGAAWVVFAIIVLHRGMPFVRMPGEPRFPITGEEHRAKGSRSMLQHLLDHPPEDPVYCNLPPLLEIYCGKQSFWLPNFRKEKLVQVAGDISGWGKPVTLVQFDSIPYIDAPQVLNYQPVALFAEGGVYKATVKKPEESWVLANFMGASSLERRDLGEAERYLSMALGLNPQSVPVHYNMACLRSLQFRRDEAMNWLKKAVDLGFDNAALLNNDPDIENIRKAPGFANLLQAAQAPRDGSCFIAKCFDK